MDQKSSSVRMQYRPTTLERAFELARSGRCENIAAIRRRLKHEGYAEGEHLVGPTLRKQLRQLMDEARNIQRPQTGVSREVTRKRPVERCSRSKY